MEETSSLKLTQVKKEICQNIPGSLYQMRKGTAVMTKLVISENLFFLLMSLHTQLKIHIIMQKYH